MDKWQLQNKINQTNSEINKLKESRKQYENMNKKINEAITKLSNAKAKMDEAKQEFKNSYSSDTATKKSSEFVEIIDTISNIINQLRNTMLPKSTERISNINYNINMKTNQLQQDKTKLNSLLYK